MGLKNYKAANELGEILEKERTKRSKIFDNPRALLAVVIFITLVCVITYFFNR